MLTWRKIKYKWIATENLKEIIIKNHKILWSFWTQCWNIFHTLECSKFCRTQEPLSRIISELWIWPTRPNIFCLSDIWETSGPDFFLIQNRLHLGQESTLHHIPLQAISSLRGSNKLWTTGCSFIYCCNTEYLHKICLICWQIQNSQKERPRTKTPAWALSGVRNLTYSILFSGPQGISGRKGPQDIWSPTCPQEAISSPSWTNPGPSASHCSMRARAPTFQGSSAESTPVCTYFSFWGASKWSH